MNRSKVNKKANREIKKQAVERNIFRCEICCSTNWITIAHRHKRRWYYDKPDELLWDYNQWIIACIDCHSKIEKNKELTEKIFLENRGKE